VIAAYIPRFGVRLDTAGAANRVDLVEKVLLDLARRYATRPGGYTRIVKFGPRRGDNAPISLIELVDGESEPKGDDKGKGGAKAVKTSAKAATAAAPTQGAKVQ
jgi:large subunit ribosomal protein L17